MASKKEPGWQEFRGTVPGEAALAEYERVKALLPPGVEPTIDMLDRHWLPRPRRSKPAPIVPQSGPAPDLLLGSSRQELEAIRDQLAADGKHHGYKSIARKAGIHPSTVRRRFGKL